MKKNKKMNNEKNIKISIIFSNFNGIDYSIDAIESILKTDYPNFEIIAVDNLSSNNEFAKLKKKYQRNKRVVVVQIQKHSYLTGALNYGAKHAKGEKFVFVNNDITVDQNWLTELIKLACKNPKYLIQPKILSYKNKKIIDAAGSEFDFFGFGRARGHDQIDQGQFDSNSPIDYANTVALMIDSNFFKKLGMFDEWFRYYYEDVDLNLRARKNGGQAWFCYKSIVYHKGSLTIKKTSSNEVLFHIRKNVIRTIMKNFSGLDQIFRLTKVLSAFLIKTIFDLAQLKTDKFLITLKAIKVGFNPKLFVN